MRASFCVCVCVYFVSLLNFEPMDQFVQKLVQTLHNKRPGKFCTLACPAISKNSTVDTQTCGVKVALTLLNMSPECCKVIKLTFINEIFCRNNTRQQWKVYKAGF